MYVALSYCWGPSKQPMALTADMLKLDIVVFSLKSLPQTIQDAVTVTRRLGFKYLWVDSMCIVQEGDEGNDYHEECAKMDQVYGNATITITASFSNSV